MTPEQYAELIWYVWIGVFAVWGLLKMFVDVRLHRKR